MNPEDTQSLPVVDAPLAHTGRHAGVHELEPMAQPAPKPPKPPSGSSIWRKALLLLGVFFAALFFGMLLSGYLHSRQQAEEQARLQAVAEQQQHWQQQQELTMQAQELEAQRAELEQQKARLEEERASLRQEAARLRGRNEQIGEERAKAGSVGQVLDRMSGKEKERQQAVQQNQAAQARAEKDADAAEQSIRDVEAALQNVDKRMQQVAQMKRDAEALAAKAETAYKENKDTIDAALYYAGQGAALVKSLLAD